MAESCIMLIEGVRCWQWFCSFTVAERGASDILLTRMFDEWLRRVAGGQNIAPVRLLSAYRIESGLDPMHRHCHALIGGLRRIERGARFTAMADWSRLCGAREVVTIEDGRKVSQFIPRGTCRIRLYDPAAGAAGYLAKQLNASEYWGWSNSEVKLSKSAFLVAWKARRLRGSLQKAM